VVDLVGLRLERGLDAILRARAWLEIEARSSPVLAIVAPVCEDTAAHYTFALGQLDCVLEAALDEILDSHHAPSGDRLDVLRRTLTDLIDYFERGERISRAAGPAMRARRWACQRAREELGPLLRDALR